MSDWYDDSIASTCLHLHITVETVGARRFIQGEVVDNIEERLRCLDCLEILSEAEVRSAWNGNAHFVEIPIQEADCGDI